MFMVFHYSKFVKETLIFSIYVLCPVSFISLLIIFTLSNSMLTLKINSQVASITLNLKKILITETQVFTFFMGIFFLFINYRNGFYPCYKINFI